MKVAIVYDFDRTLTPDDMQAQGWIQAHGYTPAAFWRETEAFCCAHGVESNLGYMCRMAAVGATEGELKEYGKRLAFYPGVEDWFGRINAYGAAIGIEVEHYVVSSGLAEMIEASAIGDKFTRVYASSFLYDEGGKAVWPKRVVDYTNKTQFLFRISKGVLNPCDPAVNDYMPPENYRIPFTNFVYLGDSATDIPCMKLVSGNGGLAIGVYESGGKGDKVARLKAEKRVGATAPADYRAGGEIEKILFSFLSSR